jgi:hypothetical protein
MLLARLPCSRFRREPAVHLHKEIGRFVGSGLASCVGRRDAFSNQGNPSWPFEMPGAREVSVTETERTQISEELASLSMQYAVNSTRWARTGKRTSHTDDDSEARNDKPHR